MFQYIPKSIWFPTSVDVKDAATIEALLELCKAGEVERVIIPFTYYGYGASLIDDSNRRSIARHYRANRLKSYAYALTMSAWQFVHNEELRELVEELQEQYPVFDEQDHSMLETETKLEFLVDELYYVLSDDETVDWTKESILEVLESGEWATRIEWWEYVETDTDGYTMYSTKENIAHLAAIVKAKAAQQRETETE